MPPLYTLSVGKAEVEGSIVSPRNSQRFLFLSIRAAHWHTSNLEGVAPSLQYDGTGMYAYTARWPISPHTVPSVCFGIIIIVIIIILRGWKRFGWLVDTGSDDKGVVAGGGFRIDKACYRYRYGTPALTPRYYRSNLHKARGYRRGHGLYPKTQWKPVDPPVIILTIGVRAERMLEQQAPYRYTLQDRDGIPL
ncbi:hypothetical protein B9Z19DRAFT_1061981 [Tuber borchii]|uniref:Uncharacterized protein n=1 Tax=Tuber borchii TaxID=42251 RepID=A0A2T7A3K2_TUBBO|nr:hypothetical protein B9Z19DRAFT_1061981 [Tuber borchii]